MKKGRMRHVIRRIVSVSIFDNGAEVVDMASSDCRSSRELAQHVLEDPAVAEILQLIEGIDAAGQRNDGLKYAIGPANLDRKFLPGNQAALDAAQRDDLVALQSERSPRGALLEHQRHHAHPDQVRTVNALEAFGNHGAD